MEVLRTSCYNCHSNETKLAWFDRIVPAYWLVVSDVKKARQKLNFSEFDKLSPGQQRGVLFESVNQMQFGAMPLKQYVLLHPESKVTPEKLAILEQYLASGRQELKSVDEPGAPSVTTSNVPPAPNGMVFPSDYKNWKAISSTERWDNNTLRVILGNDVAFTAVANNQINPWPDGTEFAKVAWSPATGDAGNLRAGAFVQVEFMLKDKNKYSSTKGWGFGRWKGTDLKPYGKDASFAEECVGCHTPMRSNDFVFTTPPLTGKIATTARTLPSNPFEWHVIGSGVNPQDGTMGTLYGNDIAARTARASSQPVYPPGAVLSLVTWNQRPDDHWFGAIVPSDIKYVEFVSVERTSRSYQAFGGSPLTKVNLPESRVGLIVDQRPSIFP